jgi:uncharacterized protein (TIGR00369 family)
MRAEGDANALEYWTGRIGGVIGQAIPMRFEEVSKERVVMTLEVDGRMHQPMGLLHGGVSVVLAESAASTGANLNCAPGMVALGQEINANHIRSIREGVLRAVAEPMHVGRSSISAIRDEQSADLRVAMHLAVIRAVPRRRVSA